MMNQTLLYIFNKRKKEKILFWNLISRVKRKCLEKKKRKKKTTEYKFNNNNKKTFSILFHAF